MSLRIDAAVDERGVELDLEVADGETLALVGPNGAGKSTALSLVSGALSPSRGRVELDSRVLSGPGVRVPPHRRRVTTLSQDPVLFPHLTAYGNIRFALRSQGMGRPRARAAAQRWLEELDLAELAGRRPSQLSGGQAQRVAIARALAADPRLVLLDEPMAALDVEVAPTLREQLRGFLAGRTAVIVTHDVLDALTLADRILVLEEGRAVEEGPTHEVLSHPRSAFAARFAGLNLLSGRWDGHGVRLTDGALLPAPAPTTAPSAAPPTGESAAASGTGTGAEASLRDAPDGVIGAEVLVVFRPAAVHLVESGGLRRTVRSLAPRGDLVRVSTEDVAADLAPQEIAARHLAPGARVQLAVPAEAVTTYRA